MTTLTKPTIRRDFTFNGQTYQLNTDLKVFSKKEAQTSFEPIKQNYQNLQSHLTMEHGEMVINKDIPYANLSVFCIQPSDVFHLGIWAAANNFQLSTVISNEYWLVKPQTQQKVDLMGLLEEHCQSEKVLTDKFNLALANEQQLALTEYKLALADYSKAVKAEATAQKAKLAEEDSFIQSLEGKTK